MMGIRALMAVLLVGVCVEGARLQPAFSLVASGSDTRYNLRFGPQPKKSATDPAAPADAHAAKKSFNSNAIHGAPVTEGLGAVVFPIYQTSTFRFDSAEDGAKCFGGESDGFIYSRINNPTVRELEKTIALLEGGWDGIATSTGMGAVNIVYLSLLGAGKHIVCHKTIYGPSRAILDSTYKNFGVEASFVDTSDVENVRKAIRPNTAMIFLESPANPTMSISDIPAIVKLAAEFKLPVVVDNTFCGPYLQRPLEQGADIVIESITKSINGHADVVGGVVVTRTEQYYKQLRGMMVNLGTSMDPNQAFLVRRGLKTLPLRVDRSQENALKVAEFLENHPMVRWVRYPGLKSHPQFELAKKLMKGPGFMISFGVEGGVEGGRKLLNSVKFCMLAVSLGGVETLIQHPASMTHAKLTPEARLQAEITDDLVRLSVGIEEVTDIIEDLSQALDKVAALAAATAAAPPAAAAAAAQAPPAAAVPVAVAAADKPAGKAAPAGGKKARR